MTHTAESIDDILDAVVSINTHVPDDALSAELLGNERSGHGVVIREDGLILTIGYLILDADRIWVGTDEDTVVPANIIACDYDSGFGLLKPAMPVDLPSVDLGSAADLDVDEPVFVLGSGGIGETIEARVIGKQEFAGRWEYLLDEAVYTAPAHPAWAGVALLNGRGRLCGIGSLLVQTSDAETSANMFVPVDILIPHLDDLCRYGKRSTPARPWLGVLIHDDEDQLQIVAVYSGCPADLAGIKPGDLILKVGDRAVAELADFYRKVWSYGPAGVSVPLTIERAEESFEITVVTAERDAYMRKDTIN